MSRAKEGSRTPTRVTPLEPEPRPVLGFGESSSCFSTGRGRYVGQQKAAPIRSKDRNSGARTETSSTGKLTSGKKVRVTQGLSKGAEGKVLGVFGSFGSNEPLYRVGLGGIGRVIRETYLEVVE